MKKSLARWFRMNQQEVFFVLVSLAIIAGVFLLLSFCSNFILKSVIIVVSLLLELIIGLHLMPKNPPQLTLSYFIAFTIGFCCITGSSIYHVNNMVEPHVMLYIILISLALLFYIIGLLAMLLQK